MTKWQTIETAPTDGRKVLAAFKGQFGWYVFVARAHKNAVVSQIGSGHALPTHWAPLPETPDGDYNYSH